MNWLAEGLITDLSDSSVLESSVGMDLGVGARGDLLLSLLIL